MNSRSIFGSSGPRPDSPFAASKSPFAKDADEDSPFSDGSGGAASQATSSVPPPPPFQTGDAPEGFGFEAPSFSPSSAPGSPPPPPFEVPAASVAAPAPSSATTSYSDSSSIRQLELRAIFGVDREMNAEEILQKARALSGVKNVATVAGKDIPAIDSIRSLLPSLGFGNVRLYADSAPLDFIREGNAMLAVQTEGGAYAPGVRETLIIVARELGRLA